MIPDMFKRMLLNESFVANKVIILLSPTDRCSKESKGHANHAKTKCDLYRFRWSNICWRRKICFKEKKGNTETYCSCLYLLCVLKVYYCSELHNTQNTKVSKITLHQTSNLLSRSSNLLRRCNPSMK